ncbi:MAG: hypothetical protein ABEK17_04595 [Candidatus Aenigmatarchaeota archaeon]
MMKFYNKGVSTLGEFIVLIGVIIVSSLFLLSFQKTITQETDVARSMSVKEIGERVAGLMNRVESEPSYTVESFKVPQTSIKIENGILTVQRGGKTFSESVPQNSDDILLNDTLKVVIVKQDNKIKLMDEMPVCNFNFICESEECFSDCEDCYGPSAVCVGDGNCTKSIGETCQNSPEDCICDNGKECCPTHPDSDENSCLNITEKRDEGSQCYCNNQCSGNLKCNPTYRNFNDFTSACCPKDKRWDGNKCRKIKTYDIYFIAEYSSYASTQEYMRRARIFADSVTKHTPFQECPEVVNTKIFRRTTVPDSKWDLKVTVTDRLYCKNGRCGCNAFSRGPGSGIVKIFKLGSSAGKIVLPHEMGHEFGLCDEYDRRIYGKQNAQFSGGCGNPWPGDAGWHPKGSCNRVFDGSSPRGTCGRDLDNNKNTRRASLMGGGGAFVDRCGNSLAIEQTMEPSPAIIGYKSWKNEINNRGYECN